MKHAAYKLPGLSYFVIEIEMTIQFQVFFFKSIFQSHPPSITSHDLQNEAL